MSSAGAAQVASLTAAAVRINAGDGAYQTIGGTDFDADHSFSGGAMRLVPFNVAATDDDPLYQSSRTSPSFSYAVAVANGLYDVTLHFVEPAAQAAGLRVFDVSAEGGVELDDYDIYAAVGARRTATQETFQVDVLDGVLDLGFTASVSRAVVSAIEVVPVSVPPADPDSRFNAGGPAYTTVLGDEFDADNGGSGGGTRTVGYPIDNTDDDTLYQSVRLGFSFAYGIAVPNGTHDVTLHFMEPFRTAAGQRVFDISAEGAVAVGGYDVFAAAGARRTAVQETFTVTVTDELLNLDFVGSTGQALVSAIEVISTGPPPYVGTPYQDVTVLAGVDAAHNLGSICDPPIGNGAAWADADGDGDQDLFTTSRGPNRFYRNDGDSDGDGVPEFTDIAVSLGLDAALDNGLSSTFIDYDNDGDQDLFVGNWNGNKLYQNQLAQGTFSFIDVTGTAGLADDGRAITAAWADFNEDGYLDVYLAKHGECGPWSDTTLVSRTDRLYAGSPSGVFTAVNEYLCDGATNCAGTDGLGFAAGWFDHDGDGDLDLYIVNDNLLGLYQHNRLFQNNGSDGLGGWDFDEISASVGADTDANGMGLGIADYDHDLDFDLAFSNSASKPGHLLQNNGGFYTDVGIAAGVSTPTQPTTNWATLFFDYDNNQWEDLLFVNGFIPVGGQANQFFVNQADGTFIEDGVNIGLADAGRGRAAAIADFNNDGWVDLFIANYGEAPVLHLNREADLGNTNHWLVVTVEGTDSNRDAIGALLRLTTPDGTISRVISSGATHGGGDQKAAFFGLGSNTSGTLTIEWPNGEVSSLGSVTADQTVHFVEPLAP